MKPIKTTVVRYVCPYCRRHHSRRPAAVEHMARCWLDPANRACKTCQHHEPAYSEPDVGYFMDEHCAIGAEPEEPQKFPTVHCPLWELSEGRVSV